jgi:alpha-aminoadipate/glutamate carrier protein LysW
MERHSELIRTRCAPALEAQKAVRNLTARLTATLYNTVAVRQIRPAGLAFTSFQPEKENTHVTRCPECDAEIDLDEDEVEEGEILSCPECDSELEVTQTHPVHLILLSDEDEEDEEEEDDEEDDDDSEEKEESDVEDEEDDE